MIFSAPGLPKGKVLDEPAEMLSVYPTLLDLCGLPAYSRNEGSSLVALMMNHESGNKEKLALTTYGMNNHSLRTPDFRYTRYEDGEEELYDHRSDPNEWFNIAAKSENSDLKNELKKFLPATNARWNIHSQYDFQPYFVEQKERTLKELDE